MAEYISQKINSVSRQNDGRSRVYADLSIIPAQN